jgi:hypothetical protein
MKTVHAILLTYLQSQTLAFCKSAEAAKQEAWNLDIKNPNPSPASKHLAAEPETLELDSDVAMVTLEMTSTADGGGRDYTALRPANDLGFFQDFAPLVQEVVEGKMKEGKKTAVDWPGETASVTVKYEGTAGEMAARTLARAEEKKRDQAGPVMG